MNKFKWDFYLIFMQKQITIKKCWIEKIKELSSRTKYKRIVEFFFSL